MTLSLRMTVSLFFILMFATSLSFPSAAEFPAMFVLGDSLVDDGNNNGLSSFAKSNYRPYGIDFPQGPTGRFTNGKTSIDFLGDLLGLSLLPAFANTLTGGIDISSGVNYASAAAGILDETGFHLGERFSLRQQIQNFITTLNQLKSQMDELELNQYVRKSLVIINIGSNDYINNYLKPSLYSTSSTLNPQDYADLLINNFENQLMVLYGLGLRKFLLAGVGPLGCVPNQLATRAAPPGQCVSSVNDMVKMFNVGLKSLVDQLNANHTGTGAIFVYGNTYEAFDDILSNPLSHGFSVTDKGCCGIGRNRGQISCIPFSIPCMNRDEYIFWDAYHPTQAFNQIIAQKAFSGPPINVKQMAQL